MTSPLEMTPRATSPSVLAALYQSHRGGALRYARWLLRNPSDAEEVVQEAFCRLSQHEKNGHTDQDRIVGLLFTTVRNLSIDLLRKGKYREAESISPINEPPAAKSQSEARQLQNEIDELISQLPTQWAEALKLRTTGELSYEQISKIMGCTKAQVRTWIYRARNQLADELSKRGWMKINRAEDGNEEL